jgi:hypothetical protein
LALFGPRSSRDPLSLDDFLAKYVDSYLLRDLERFSDLGDSPGPGLCLFPQLQTIITGCEMLGRIGSGCRDADAFNWFLQKMRPRGISDEDGREFYGKVRNGVMHTWLANVPLDVHRDRAYAPAHLTVSANGHIVIELHTFHQEFKAGVTRVFRSEEFKDQWDRFQKHLDDWMVDRTKATTLFEMLPPAPSEVQIIPCSTTAGRAILLREP